MGKDMALTPVRMKVYFGNPEDQQHPNLKRGPGPLPETTKLPFPIQDWVPQPHKGPVYPATKNGKRIRRFRCIAGDVMMKELEGLGMIIHDQPDPLEIYGTIHTSKGWVIQCYKTTFEALKHEAHFQELNPDGTEKRAGFRFKIA